MLEKTINLVGIHPNGTTLCLIDIVKSIHKINKHAYVIIEPITEEQEIAIEKSVKRYGNIRFKRKDGVVIEAKDIYLYGHVDFDNDEDLDLIDKFNLIDKSGSFIHSNFNYNAGNFTTIDRKAKFYLTYDAILRFKYCHVLIGKPERIIVYKYVKK